MKLNVAKKKKKWLIAGVIVILIAVAVVPKLLGGGGDQTMMVSTSGLERTDVQQIVSIKGTVQGSEIANIASSEEKEITSIQVKEGDVVSKGQVLANLKPNAEDSKTQWGYDKQQTRKNLELAQYEYDVNKKLYEAGGISKQEFLKIETSYENSKSQMAALNAKTFTEHQNQIVSPIAGTVTRVNATLGLKANDTQNKGALFVVENLSNLEMNVKASEYDIGKIQLGQTVEITAEVLGEQKVQGVVSHISPTGEAKESNSKEMVVPIRISITEANSKLIAGVTAKANILVGEAKNVLAVPLDAVATDLESGGSYVWVVEKGICKKIPITLGLESDFFAELKDGKLKEGAQLILNPTEALTDGMEVVTDAGGATDDAEKGEAADTAATVAVE